MSCIIDSNDSSEFEGSIELESRKWNQINLLKSHFDGKVPFNWGKQFPNDSIIIRALKCLLKALNNFFIWIQLFFSLYLPLSLFFFFIILPIFHFLCSINSIDFIQFVFHEAWKIHYHWKQSGKMMQWFYSFLRIWLQFIEAADKIRFILVILKMWTEFFTPYTLHIQQLMKNSTYQKSTVFSKPMKVVY